MPGPAKQPFRLGEHAPQPTTHRIDPRGYHFPAHYAACDVYLLFQSLLPAERKGTREPDVSLIRARHG